MLNRGVIADLPMLRTLVAIHQNSLDPSFYELWQQHKQLKTTEVSET